MVHIRELEASLRSIKTKCISAVDEHTGGVDNEVISVEAQKLKIWIDDLENMYIEEAKRRPTEAPAITRDGRELLEEAWHVYEVLLDVELQAGEPPVPTKYGQLPSGYVSGEARSEALILLRDLAIKFDLYRRTVLKG